mgnify:FL=1|nr:MAG TPA: hypothetical protein [Caudoviricetes sp.]
MGNKLENVLKAKGVSQAKLAEDVGVSQAFVSYMIKGYKQPSVTLLKRMAEYLGVTADELI